MNLKKPVSLLLVLGALAAAAGISRAQNNTAFTYQGSLSLNGSPATGSYDFLLGLYTNISGGTAVGTLTNSAVAVANGIFTTTLDFHNAFNGAPMWLDIGVRPGGSSGAFTSLTARQAVTPAPYALYAPSAGTVTGVISNANLPANVAYLNSNAVFTGMVTATKFFGDGSALTGIASGSSGLGNYLFAYDTTTQSFFSSPSTFQLVGFNNPSAILNGWTFSPIGPSRNFFTAAVAGIYQFTYQTEVSGTPGRTVSFNATVNFIEIPGSQSAVMLATNGVTPISKTFLATMNANDTVRIQFTTDALSANLIPGGTGTTRPSASLTIVKVN